MAEQAAQNSSTPAEAPWHAAFPSPETTVDTVSRDEVLQWLKDHKEDFVLVDVRRTDLEGGMIRGSINLPAQSLYHTIPALCNMFSAAGKRKIVWFCGSSNGRGPRCAGWFADFLQTHAIDEQSMKSLILEGGIKGWLKAAETSEEYKKYTVVV